VIVATSLALPLSVVLPHLALALEPTLFSGSWNSVVGIDTAAENPQEDVGVWRNRVDLDLRHPLADDARVHLSARLWHRAAVGHRPGSWAPDFRADWPDFGARYDAWADLREAAVQWDTRWGRLTLGRDIVQWGALEVLSPLRLLNPVDFSQGFFGGLGSGDTLAMADWMARLSTPVAGGTWEWVFQPFFSQHRFSPFATDVAFVRADLGPALPQSLFSLVRRADLRLDRSLSDALTQALKPPPATPLAGSLSTRFQRRLGEVELAAVAMYNWDRLPKLTFDPDLQLVLGTLADAGFDQAQQVAAFADPAVQAASQRLAAAGKGFGDLVQAEWQRRLLLGLEASGELAEGLAWRFDAAYSPKLGNATGNVLFDRQFRPVVSSLVQAGLGLEWQYGDWLVALAEANWQWAVDVPASTQLFLTARHQVVVAGAVVLRLGDGQPWTLQAGGMRGVTLGDWALAPRLAYEWTSGWQAGLGAAFAGGPPTSPAGLVRTDNQLLFDVRKPF
jgi:hypothetical protein